MNSKKDKLLNDTYYKWIQTSLYDLPLDGVNDFVDPKIMGYGTAIDEKVLSISEYRDLLNNQREQSVGLEMSFESTPVFRSISNKEDSAIIVDEIKASIILKEGKQELFLRLTTILEYTNSKWIVVHWHGSLPSETKAEDDVWLVNEWQRKNEQLQKLVDEKTSELLNKNRELEIEGSLEKVRSSALAMKQHSDMLEVCQIISEQLSNLKVNDIRNVQTAIFYESKGTYFDYEFYSKHNKTFITEIDYKNHELQTLFANQMLNGAEKLFTRTFKDKELKDWYEYQKNTNQFADPFLETAESLNYYWYSLGPVALGMSTYNPLNDEEINLFKRFRNVFELACRRFLDIQKAEAQAREAQIEASLERVRAVAMGMHKSEDLIGICEVSYKEFRKLGFDNIRNALIHIQYDEQKYFMDYDFSDLTGGAITKIEYGSHPIVEDYVKQIRSAKDAFYQGVIKEDQLEEWKNFRRNSGQIDDPRLDKATALYYYFFSIGIGDIGISTFEPIDESQIKILKRFRNVFDLAYRRYTDIALAEAQSREARIEAALEKIRSRALAMRNSSEVGNVSTLLFSELEKMDINPSGFSIMIFDEEQDKYELWRAKEVAHQGAYETFSIKAMYDKFDKYVPGFGEELKSAWTKGSPFFVGEFRGEKRVSFLQANREMANYSAEVFEKMKKSWPDPTFWHLVFFKYGWFGVLQNEQLIKEDLLLIHRFAEVFDFAYTRFLDLQKAEAQAREAQIEAALERVRSRSMGMQKSEELKNVIRVVYEQFVHLKIDVDHAGFVVDYTPKGDWYFWIADEQDIPSKITHPYFESVWANQFNEAKEKGIDFFATNLNFEEKNQFYNELLSYVPGLPKASKDFYLSCPGLSISTVLLENVGLYIENFSGTPYSDEENKILIRFGNVFQQTYTRFLDLQKAEAQAREAKIEASLERVRSKAMAMHSPNDLLETVNIFFKELKTLGIIPIRCGVGQIDGATRTTSLTTTTSYQQGESFQVIGKVKQTGHPVLDGIFEHWKLKKEYFPVLEGEDIKAYYDVMNPQIGYPEYPQGVTQYGNNFFFQEGFVFAWTENLLSEEELIIFRRFTSVLSLTFRRYMDLKEAEEQAKEAKIEASLEKVRSKTMAMQSSEELADTATVVFQQLINLGIEPNRIYITIIKDETGACEFWITDEDGSKVSSGFKANLNENHSFKKMYEGWKENKKSISIDMQGEELEEYFRHLSKLNVPFKGGLSQKRRIQYIAYFSKGFIGVASPDETKLETLQLLERFAAVFNLTYTRFNDLKQAEAQNKIIQADNDRKTKELEDARQLQLSMLPKELPQLPNLDIAVHMKTATEVGGDYYDFNVDANGILTFVVGDATGHGMMSGMMVSIMKSFFISNRNNIELKQFFENCNNSIKDMHLGRLMMSFMGVQITSRKLVATNAGMPSLIYFRNRSQKAGEFVSNNLPLGAMKGTRYLLKEIVYEKGDTLLLMSDGFAELKNKNKEQYGYPRIIEEFKSVAYKNSEMIVEHLKNSASEWMNGIEPDDDVTFVVIKVR